MKITNKNKKNINNILGDRFKKASYPLEEYCGHCGYDGSYDYLPTLSQLIEVLGNKFHKLEKDRRLTSSKMETAEDYFIAYGYIQGDEQEGRTPIEAVANLWFYYNEI